MSIFSLQLKYFISISPHSLHNFISSGEFAFGMLFRISNAYLFISELSTLELLYNFVECLVVFPPVFICDCRYFFSYGIFLSAALTICNPRFQFVIQRIYEHNPDNAGRRGHQTDLLLEQLFLCNFSHHVFIHLKLFFIKYLRLNPTGKVGNTALKILAK